LNDNTRYQISYPNVVAESFGSETVIVNLAKGTYFSLDEIASILWTAVTTRASISSIKRAIHSNYPQDEKTASNDFEDFLETLIKHELIETTNETSGDIVIDFPAARYSKPVITVHSDLQDILLLDPVHDINEEGWPSGANS
jgi:hypothetical protein